MSVLKNRHVGPLVAAVLALAVSGVAMGFPVPQVDAQPSSDDAVVAEENVCALNGEGGYESERTVQVGSVMMTPAQAAVAERIGVKPEYIKEPPTVFTSEDWARIEPMLVSLGIDPNRIWDGGTNLVQPQMAQGVMVSYCGGSSFGPISPVEGEPPIEGAVFELTPLVDWSQILK